MSKRIATTEYVAVCKRCNTEYKCVGHQKCPECGGINRVLFKAIIKETIHNATAGL